MKKKLFMLLTALVVTLTSINVVNAEETLSVPKNSNMAHIDANSNNALDFGEEVCIGNECFYVIQADTNTKKVDLLTKYNLKVGYRVHAQNEAEGFKRFSFEMTDATGIQDSTALGGYKGQVSGDFVGIVDFDETKINEYISNYMTYLSEEYGVSATGKVMDADTVHVFGCDINESCTSTPDWFHSTSYWINILGSQNEEAAIIRDELQDGEIPKIALSVTNDLIAGVRPVVTVDAQLFDAYTVNVDEPDNGTLEVVVKDGGIVITATPDEGFELDVLEVTDFDNNEVEITDNGDGTYTIKTVNANLNINAAFKEADESETEGSTTDNNTTTDSESKDQIENPNTSDNVLVYIAASIMSIVAIVSVTSIIKKNEM